MKVVQISSDTWMGFNSSVTPEERLEALQALKERCRKDGDMEWEKKYQEMIDGQKTEDMR